MTKKEIWVTLGIFLVVLVGVGAGIFVLSRGKSTAQADAVSLNTMGESQAQQDAMTLNPTQPDQGTSSNDGLTVVAGANTANPGQLGSGQTASRQDSPSSSNAKTAPGPESFGDYEKYKNNPSTLTGDMVIGSGDELKAGYQAAVYYKGWLTNGQMFDQSRTGSDGKLQPFILTLGAHQVIRGWEEGLLGMKVGGTRRIIIPPALGYGATGQGSIPANAVLVFDVQLLEIKAP
jgi:FKBP-type peptidyl-prolyl cis-trans isomerase FkpA